MTAVLFLAAGLAVGGVGGSLGTHRLHERRRFVADLDAIWTPADREAMSEELAEVIVARGYWHRNAIRLEQVARQAGLFVNRRRRPIPLPAAQNRSDRSKP